MERAFFSKLKRHRKPRSINMFLSGLLCVGLQLRCSRSPVRVYPIRASRQVISKLQGWHLDLCFVGLRNYIQDFLVSDI